MTPFLRKNGQIEHIYFNGLIDGHGQPKASAFIYIDIICCSIARKKKGKKIGSVRWTKETPTRMPMGCIRARSVAKASDWVELKVRQKDAFLPNLLHVCGFKASY